MCFQIAVIAFRTLNGPLTEGIFRKPASRLVIDQLEKNPSQISRTLDVYAVGDLIKRYTKKGTNSKNKKLFAVESQVFAGTNLHNNNLCRND